jgi:hypothetical protein
MKTRSLIAALAAKNPPITFLLCLTLLLFGGYVYMSLQSSASRQEVVQQVFRDQQVFDSFLSSSKVTAQRLRQGPEQQSANSGILGGYISSNPVPVSRKDARKLKRLLQGPSSYYWGTNQKQCIADYGLLLTFHSGQSAVRVALCFKCNWLGVFDGLDANAREINTKLDFDPARKKLVAIAKSIYPDDPEIQDLE